MYIVCDIVMDVKTLGRDDVNDDALLMMMFSNCSQNSLG